MKEHSLTHVTLRRLNADMRNKVVKMRGKGVTLSGIRSSFEKNGYFISDYTIIKILKQVGVYKVLNQKPIFTEEEKKKILEMRMNHISVTDIGVLIHHTPEYVRQYLQEVGMYESCKGNHHYFTDEDLERMLKMRKRGYSYKKIGEVMGCCEDTVKKRLAGLREEGYDPDDEEKYDWRTMDDFEADMMR